MTIQDVAGRALRELSDADSFLEAVRAALPELWHLWRNHKKDVEALRVALRELNDELARARAATDAALDAKHKDD